MRWTWICNIYQFLWYKYSHHDPFQATMWSHWTRIGEKIYMSALSTARQLLHTIAEARTQPYHKTMHGKCSFWWALCIIITQESQNMTVSLEIIWGKQPSFRTCTELELVIFGMEYVLFSAVNKDRSRGRGYGRKVTISCYKFWGCNVQHGNYNWLYYIIYLCCWDRSLNFS